MPVTYYDIQQTEHSQKLSSVSRVSQLHFNKYSHVSFLCSVELFVLFLFCSPDWTCFDRHSNWRYIHLTERVWSLFSKLFLSDRAPAFLQSMIKCWCHLFIFSKHRINSGIVVIMTLWCDEAALPECFLLLFFTLTMSLAGEYICILPHLAPL